MVGNETGKRDGGARFGRHLRHDLLRALAIALLAALSVAALPRAGRQAATRRQENESLLSRIERIVKEKEPDWKLEQKHERKGAEHKYFMQGWTLGKEYVSTTTYQMKDSTATAKAIVDSIRSPISVPVRITKIEGLGDEAYTLGEGPYGKKGSGTLILRRVNLLIRLDSSSLETAKRFARHMIEAVDELCGGAQCEPMN
ncbi:MAG TPA: hypothetical protein VF543_04005 [Pyrinomonadaceae bacterium]|jgi:hypothetical protein